MDFKISFFSISIHPGPDYRTGPIFEEDPINFNLRIIFNSFLMINQQRKILQNIENKANKYGEILYLVGTAQ